MRITLACLVALGFLAPGASGQGRSDAVPAAVDAIVSGHVSSGRARAAALVIVAGDRIIFARGYGEGNPGVPVDPETTLFRTASVSKLFVATAAATLADEGQLDLQADIRRYLPDVEVRNSFPEPITTAQLLTHTSGIADSFLHALARDPKDLVPVREFFRRYPPEVVRAPGTGIAYSNLGMALAGAVVEAVSGERFDDFADARLLGPLGMTRSSFRQPPPGGLASATAGSQGTRQPPLIRPFPAGSLVATVQDMGRFLIAQLNEGRIDGRQAIPPGAIALTHSRHFGDARAQGAGYGFFESTLNGEHALFHTGDSGHHSLLWMVPSRSLGIFVVYATSDQGALEMREEVASAALGALGTHAAVGAEPRPAVSDLSPYSGWYTMNGAPTRTVEHIMGLLGQVHISAIDRSTLRIRPPGAGTPITASRLDTDLFRTSDGGTLAFTRDKAERPSGFTMTGSIWDPQGFHRVGWSEAQPVALVVFIMTALCLIVRGAIAASWLWRRKTVRVRSSSLAADLAWRLSGILPFLLLAVPAAAIVGILVSPPPFIGLPRGVTAGFGLLTLAAAIGTLMPIGAVAGLREPGWSGFRRWFLVVYSGVMVAFAWTLQHWSLLLRP